MEKSHNSNLILELKSIVKDFPGQRALDNINFDVQKGEVHALVGENGAGKSTLIKILAGLYHKDTGEILMNGLPVNISRPHDSQKLGLSFIHQELNIIAGFSALENMFLGRKYPRNRFGIIDKKKMLQQIKSLPDAIDIGIDLRTPAGNLSLIQQWQIIINRALTLQSKIIFMDEPTASLSYHEIKQLFNTITHLKEKGTSIVYVSHRIEEIFEIADRVTILKDAKKVGTYSLKELDPQKIYHKMLDRDLKDIFPTKHKPAKGECLKIENISSGNRVKNISFTIAPGEILGIAGVVGSGRTELAQTIFGITEKNEGKISINGKQVTIKRPKDAIKHGIALVPEKRASEGIVRSMDIKQNITMSSLEQIRTWAKVFIMNHQKERSTALTMIHKTNINTQTLSLPVNFLSGGNQQKVVLSKWLCTNAKIYIFDEPTKGIDVGAKAAIYEQICSLAREGAAIMLISSDLTEIMGLSHRILVIDKGSKKRELLTDDSNFQEILQLCLGNELQETSR